MIQALEHIRCNTVNDSNCLWSYRIAQYVSMDTSGDCRMIRTELSSGEMLDLNRAGLQSGQGRIPDGLPGKKARIHVSSLWMRLTLLVWGGG